MTAPARFSPCSVCRGDGCSCCSGAGFIAAPPEPWLRAPRAPVLPHAGPLLLVSARDGWAAWDQGDRWARPRWAICASADGRKPLQFYRNGGPKGLDRPTSGDAAPLWHGRAARFVASCGGLPLAKLGPCVAWFRGHRSGAPDLSLVETWGE